MTEEPIKPSEQPGAYAGPALLSHGFRPFFLGAGLLAAAALPLWLATYLGLVAVPGLGDPLRWHMHEMLFGYLGAALAGFLLTAIPNWTGRPPIAGAGLAALFALWVAGRLAMLVAAETLPAALLAGAFPVVLAVVAWREVIAGGNRRNLPVCLLVSSLAVAQVVFLFGHEGLGTRLGFATAVVLLLLIGGRITPSFTRNWLKQRGAAEGPAAFDLVDKLALAAGLVAALSWIVAPDHRNTGLAFALAAALNLWRLGRWRGAATTPEPLLLALHVAYAWLPVAFALFALAILAPGLATPQQAMHALGAGAIGQMTLAVMTRASLGHAGRPLRADAATSAAYLFVLLGAAARVAAEWSPEPLLFVQLGAALWTAGFVVFVVRYAPILCTART